MCRTGCPTQNCGSYAACLKGMNLQVGDLTGNSDAQITARRLDLYASARKQGLQPPSTKVADVRRTLQEAGA